MSNKVAVVTGANKGIGYAIVKELLERGVGTVYLTARDVARGKAAVEKLKKEGVNPEFHQLEVTDKESIKALATYLKQKHGGFDILINNAGVIVENLYKSTYADAKRVIDINYRSILLLKEHLYPVIKDNGRIVNISSDTGHISNLRNREWINRLTKEDLKIEDIEAFIDWFLTSLKNENLKREDFVQMCMLPYIVSKISLSALTRIQQKQVGRGISINSLHPGFVQTDMTKNVGIGTAEDSGKATAYLALDVDQSVKGKYFWFDKTEKDWADASQDLYCRFEIFEQHLKDAGAL